MKEPLKVAHLIHTLGVSGAEKHLLFLLPALKDLGIDCELICITNQKSKSIVENYLRQFEKAGIKTSLLTYKSKIRFWNISRKIAHYLIQQQAQIVHAHLFNSDIIAGLIKTFFYKKFILISTKHGYNEDYLAGINQAKITKEQSRYRMLSRWAYNQSDYNIAVSQALADLYFELGISADKMQVIHHGIPDPETKNDLREISDSPCILTVGRLVKFKGHTYLLKALPDVIKSFPGVKLIILGEGPELGSLKKEAAQLGITQHIDFAGHDLPSDYVSHSDIMVIPSLYEAFGLVYIEAFAMKIPLIAFRGGASEEIIDDMENGILVAQGDFKELAQKIIFLLERSDLRKSFAESGYLKFQNQFTIQKMAKETAEFYVKAKGL